MNNITHKLDDIYLPEKALVIYRSQAGQQEEVYVESYDMDEQGCPINAHPLSVQETIRLATCLNRAKEVQTDYLTPKGLLPEELLYLHQEQGYAIWYTPVQKVNLFFKECLQIPCGIAPIPALLWKADRTQLWLYALKGKEKPFFDTVLYQAPFFNIYENGAVCMGTVEKTAEKANCLERFIEIWEQAFWNSYFSHLNGDTSPVQGNIIQLWNRLVGTNKPFPQKVLRKQGLTLKQLIR